MPLSIDGPQGAFVVDVQPLCQQAFAGFGTVVENPAPGIIPGAHLRQIPEGAVQANQGSALKYHDVTDLLDLYTSAPSKVASRAVMNMFVCAPRPLHPSRDGSDRVYFPVEILERHPFTTQTFIPLGLSSGGEEGSQYLVIVAPSLGPSPNDLQFPVPDAAAAAQGRLPGRGLPDLTKIKAFLATGSQAVTYGAGTWHAPMVVVGKHPVPFVVAQFANGVGIEDCQEVVWETEPDAPIRVSVPKMDGSSLVRSSKL